MSLSDKVLSLVVATNKLMLDVEVSKMKEFQKNMLDFFQAEHSVIVAEIEETKTLSDELKDKILEAAREYKSRC